MSQDKSTLLEIKLSILPNQRNNIFEYIQNGILITNRQSEIVYINPAFTRITGYNADEMLGKNPRVLHSGRHNRKFFEDIWKSIKENDRWEGVLWNRRKSGETFPIYMTISSLISEKDDIFYYIAVISDITLLKQDESRYLKLAFYDPLTELPNRSLYQERLSHAIDKGKTDSALKHAILFMDLDNFKKVNDTFGHVVGDHLLKMVGQRLTSMVRAGDTVARIGGDEFTAILHGIQDKTSVKQLAQRIVESIEKPFVIDGHEIFVAISIGISFYPDDANQFDDLLAGADKAMYDAKKNVRKIQYYDAL